MGRVTTSTLLAQGHFVVYRNVPEAGKKDKKVRDQPKNSGGEQRTATTALGMTLGNGTRRV